MAYQVSIGRNVNGYPMEKIYWEEFQKEVLNAVTKYAREIHSKFGGVGYWQGQEEESAALIFSLDVPPTKLKNELRLLGRKYHQEAIAWTKGKTEFLT